MPTRRRFGAAAASLALASLARAQGAAWPGERPIEAIVPFPPGGGVDVMTRLILPLAQARLPGSQFVVINRASPNPRDNDVNEAKEAICECENFVISEVVVRERVAVKRAAPKGLTVAEYRPLDPKAVEEMDALYRLAFGEE